MKKVLVVLLVLIIGAGAFLYFPRGSVIEAVNAAVIAVLQAGVDAARGGTETFQEALDGEVFATGDVVRANDNGRAVLTFFDGSTVSVDPKSRLVVKSLTKTASGGLQLELEQTAGRTWASVSKLVSPDSKFTIRTPSMTALVRGTTFETIVETQPDGTVTTLIKTTEGEVVVQAVTGGPQVTVPAGQEVEVQQNQPAPPAPRPQPPTPKLRFSAPAGVGFNVIDPRGLQCGMAAAKVERQIPRCDVVTGAGQTVVIGEVVAGAYSLVATAAQAVTNAAIVAEGLGTTGAADFSVKLERTINVGDLLRSTLPVTLGEKLGSSGFTAPELVTSVCGAESTGRVFSGGGLTERADALVAFAAQQKGAPIALVYTQDELTAEARKNLQSQQANLPVTVSDVSVTVDNGGLHLNAKATAGPLTVPLRADIIAGTSADGKLLMRLRNIDAGPLPAAAKDPLITNLNQGLAQFAASMPLVVTRVAFRSGCFALIGKTPG